MDGVQIRIGEIPEFYGAKILEMNGVGDGVGGGCRSRNGLCSFGDNLIAFTKVDFPGEGFLGGFEIHQEAIHVEGGFRRKNILWLGKNIFDEGAGNNAERHFTVNAAEGEVVDLKPGGISARSRNRRRRRERSSVEMR